MTSQPAHPAATSGPAGHAPRWVTVVNPLTRRLLAAHVPLGPNGLLTVRGRTSGLPRSTPLAVINVEGRRWVWAPWGEVDWVRNLRAAGRATLTAHGRTEEVGATELDEAQRAAFFRDVLDPLAGSIPLGRTFIRLVDGVDLRQPAEAAKGRRVFELRSI